MAAYLYSGETYEAAATRRLLEELGLGLALERFTVTRMRDGESTKFIALFLCRIEQTDLPEICEPDHVEALRYWHRDEIDRALAEAPDTFTGTFRHLYGLYRGQVTSGAALH